MSLLDRPRLRSLLNRVHPEAAGGGVAAAGPTRLTDEEIWNLDESLAAVIADAVRRLRDMDHGYPAGLSAGAWQAILTEIADDFQRYADAEDDGMDLPPYKGLALISQWWCGLWD